MTMTIEQLKKVLNHEMSVLDEQRENLAIGVNLWQSRQQFEQYAYLTGQINAKREAFRALDYDPEQAWLKFDNAILYSVYAVTRGVTTHGRHDVRESGGLDYLRGYHEELQAWIDLVLPSDRVEGI